MIFGEHNLAHSVTCLNQPVGISGFFQTQNPAQVNLECTLFE
jgi:hypothetical protein